MVLLFASSRPFPNQSISIVSDALVALEGWPVASLYSMQAPQSWGCGRYDPLDPVVDACRTVWM